MIGLFECLSSKEQRAIDWKNLVVSPRKANMEIKEQRQPWQTEESEEEKEKEGQT